MHFQKGTAMTEQPAEVPSTEPIQPTELPSVPAQTDDPSPEPPDVPVTQPTAPLPSPPVQVPPAESPPSPPIQVPVTQPTEPAEDQSGLDLSEHPDNEDNPVADDAEVDALLEDVDTNAPTVTSEDDV